MPDPAQAKAWRLLRVLLVWRQTLSVCSGRLPVSGWAITPLGLFGLVAVAAMLVCYACERRSPWFILAFAVACWAGSVYGFLQGAWPFGLVEAVWGLVAVRRWRARESCFVKDQNA
jgi:hypothetical protein